MNPDEEQYFLDLATKVIANRANTEEVREFEMLLSQSSEHRERFETFKTDVVVARDIMTLVGAAEAKGPGLTPTQFSRLEREIHALARKRAMRRWLIGVAILLLLIVAVLIALKVITRSNSETLTSDDISVPDGVMIVTINKLNAR
jgi:hypothetical protein